MWLILAHRHDLAGRQLAARWGGEAVLLTPADLHEEHLQLTVDGRGDARAALPSRPEVVSILSRLGGVGPVDLEHVDPQDVSYAATELSAFLWAWLAAWPGPVLNRPTATCLNGPGWSPEQWILAAATTGLPVRPVRRLAPTGGSYPPTDVASGSDLVQATVVGDRWFGAVSEDTGRRLCALANNAGCVLMDAVLDTRGTVVRLGAWPDVSAPEVAAALAPILDGGS